MEKINIIVLYKYINPDAKASPPSALRLNFFLQKKAPPPDAKASCPLPFPRGLSAIYRYTQWIVGWVDGWLDG